MMLNEPCTIQVRTYFTVNVEVLGIYIYTFIAMNNYITTLLHCCTVAIAICVGVGEGRGGWSARSA